MLSDPLLYPYIPGKANFNIAERTANMGCDEVKTSDNLPTPEAATITGTCRNATGTCNRLTSRARSFVSLDSVSGIRHSRNTSRFPGRPALRCSVLFPA